ncbi:MAG TPA: alcohol dehydrogenase catalytic domain-containing protein [Phycisphaerae bacterium]|nr:alcohol dehydrogenase catalytic domain-containing protein [Phycisphaerae bacterium]
MKAIVYKITPVRWVGCKLLGLISKGVFVTRLGGLRLLDVPEPRLSGDRWVKIRTRYGGVCGTDLALITLRNHPNTILQQHAAFPAVLGHENVGEIVEAGPAVSRFSVGQRVCADPAIGCEGRELAPLCRNCAAGIPSLCETPGGNGFPPRALLGLNPRTGGSWSELFVAHESQLHAVPDAISDETAALVDPIASAAHAALRCRPHPEESILVHGSGIIALGVLASLRALGHRNRITALVRHSFQRDLATQCGADHVIVVPRRTSRIDRHKLVAADTGGIRLDGRMGNQSMLGGYDLVYECSGNAAGLTDALMWTRGRGTLVAIGTTGIAMHDSTPLWFDELNVVGANGRQIENIDGRRIHTYDLVFEWLAQGRLNLSNLPVARFSLAEYREAVMSLLNRARRPVVKVLFAP